MNADREVDKEKAKEEALKKVAAALLSVREKRPPLRFEPGSVLNPAPSKLLNMTVRG